MADFHSIEAEQSLLGAILTNNAALAVVDSIVQAEHFFEPMHREIYTILAKLIEMGKIATPVTVKPFLPVGLDIGGLTLGAYIARLQAEATTVVNAPDFARTIRDFADRRMMAELGTALLETIGPDVADLAAYGVDMLDSIVSERSNNSAKAVMMGDAVVRAVDAAAHAYSNDGQMIGLPSGLSEYDAKTLGAADGDLILLAGRPGMGKTALAGTIARNLAKAGHHGIFFSLEMGDVQLAQRMLADEMYDDGSPLQYWKLRGGKFKEQDFMRIREAAERLQNLPLKIEQQPQLSLAQIAARARQYKRRHGLRFMIVDHLGLMASSSRYSGNRAYETGEKTAGLKALAKELGIPIFLLAQLNRGVEAREDKRPQLADLRDSGEIEQDADVVTMLYRPAYYLQNREPKVGTNEHMIWQDDLNSCWNRLDLLIQKQRAGPVGTVRVMCDIGCNAIRDVPDEMNFPNDQSGDLFNG